MGPPLPPRKRTFLPAQTGHSHFAATQVRNTVDFACRMG
jgi:hypothetical protein